MSSRASKSAFTVLLLIVAGCGFAACIRYNFNPVHFIQTADKVDLLDLETRQDSNGAADGFPGYTAISSHSYTGTSFRQIQKLVELALTDPNSDSDPYCPGPGSRCSGETPTTPVMGIRFWNDARSETFTVEFGSSLIRRISGPSFQPSLWYLHGQEKLLFRLRRAKFPAAKEP